MSSLAILTTVIALSLGQSDAQEKMQDLQCFVGTWESKGIVPEWVKETPYKDLVGQPYTARISCRWGADKAAQATTFEINIGEITLKSRALRGVDRKTGEIREFGFGSAGGSTQAVFTKNGDHWIVKGSEISAEGTESSDTSTFIFSDKDTLTIKITDRKMGDTTLPDWEVVYNRIKRKK
jgi:hypothetical protein